MTLAPILDAPLIVQLHILCAIPALLVGPFALFVRTSWRLHKIAGYTWMTAMTALSLTGLAIPSHVAFLFGHFGPIHAFSFLGLWGVFDGLRLARRRQIAAHRISLKWTWFGAMGAASLANFLPGRTINRTFLQGLPDAGYYVILAGAIALLLLWRRDRGRALHPV